MSRTRYDQIKTHLHVSPPSLNTSANQWFMKLSPLYEHLRAAFKRYIFPPQNVSVDEMMVGFSGRSLHTLKAKHKPIKEGYKIWGLCFHGYTYDFMWYSRTQRTAELKLQ